LLAVPPLATVLPPLDAPETDPPFALPPLAAIDPPFPALGVAP
jgi:hypothetical protein